MRLQVDPEECAGYGVCVDILPVLFELDDDGYARVRGKGTVPPQVESEAVRAVDECPVKAIARVAE